MKNTIIVGTQWGDEGKGKIIDILSSKADYIVRYHGGNNAGHTVVIGNEKMKFNLIPSGILWPKTKCILGEGMVIDPEHLLFEMENLKKKGIKFKNRFYISENAHVVMPYHKALEKAREERLEKDKIGTTMRGIGPAYMDKLDRVGIRMVDLIEPDVFKARLKKSIDEKNFLLRFYYKKEKIDQKDILNRYLKYAGILKQYIVDTNLLIEGIIKTKKSVLFEGAHGAMLDINFGTYPYVTSSSCITGSVFSNLGINSKYAHSSIGITKAYTTRVGEGPFPTELFSNIAEKLRKEGGEYGTSTGRPRRCGWFDALVVRKACRINGLDKIALMKLDVLNSFDKIKICTKYKYKGKTINEFPNNLEVLRNSIPVYEESDGWKRDISCIRNYDDLPVNARKYLKKIEALIRTKIWAVSVGPERSQTIFKK